MSFIRYLDDASDEAAESLGGKGWNLKVLLAAGFAVPPAFCLTSAAHRAARSDSVGPPTLGEELQGALAAAYEKLGRGRVAVRSSATVEDGSISSFAGLQETVLGVEGEAKLCAAVERCWRSIDSERARLYREQQQIDESQVAMAVVVQRLIEAEVAGVLFTRDPLDATGQAMLVEASWGLGEAVVSGRVTPDRFQVHRQTGEPLGQTIASKNVEITATGERSVDEPRRSQPCLDSDQLHKLAELGRRVEAHYGEPRDIEWAWAEGRLWLLQARPITVAGAAEREAARRREIERLRSLADPRGTVWAKYNLAEVLPSPTPMTWAIVRRFMSGLGGMGLMFHDLGFDPDPVFDELGYIDLVCGRPYVNLSREAKMHFRGFPYHHDFATLRAEPHKALYPQPTIDQSQVTFGFFLRLPKYLFKMWRAGSRIAAESRALADRLRTRVYPQFAAQVARGEQCDLTRLSPDELVGRFYDWAVAALDSFARESLKPAVIAATALGQLEKLLAPSLGAERAAIEARGLMTGVRPDAEADLGTALRDLAAGRMPRESFLRDFGHRGPQEMELASPRWREAPEWLTASAHPAHVASPAEGNDSEARIEKVVATANLNRSGRKAFDEQLRTLQTYLALRETSKHYFMLVYGMIRRVLVEFGRRSGLEDDVFFLEPKELYELLAGENHDWRRLVDERKQLRKLLLTIDVPQVLFSDDLEAIGRPLPITGAAELVGTPVSAGVVEAPALVLEEPTAADGVRDGFVLVCPSTDPAWVPLFLRAGGLVMETGGVLSHGAIVAREFGLPAVAGIGGVQRHIRTGQRVRVDGNTGRVHLFE